MTEDQWAALYLVGEYGFTLHNALGVVANPGEHGGDCTQPPRTSWPRAWTCMACMVDEARKAGAGMMRAAAELEAPR